VDSFLLSCRALGRGVEHRMLARLGEIAKERGLDEVAIPLIPTARNRPAQTLLQGIGAVFEEAAPVVSVYRFPADYLARISLTHTSSIPPAAQPHSPEATLPAKDAKDLDYARIARELRDPSRILEHIRGNRAIKAGSSQDEPRTELERRLADLWGSLLGLGSVGVNQNFFDLGGHSLMAVQMLSQVRQMFDVDLSLKVVYDGDFTVAELAKAIELRQIETAGADQYATILEELEQLSDEEVRAMLAEEDNHLRGGNS
jgi:acyl carrier protein